MTYTYAILEVSPACWQEIAGKLRAAGYDHAFHDFGAVLDMAGLALRVERVPADVVERSDRQGGTVLP